MGLIILLALGCVTGWLAAILMRTEDMQSVVVNIAAASAASLALGIGTSSGSVFQGISVAALLFAFLGAIAAVTMLAISRSKSTS